MQKTIRQCDRQVNGQPCGELVPGDTPTSFVIDNKRYQLDLCDKHRAELVANMEPFTQTASNASKTTTQRRGRGKTARAVVAVTKSKSEPFTTKEVREWLREQGKAVPPTGRIANDLIEEYKLAVGV